MPHRLVSLRFARLGNGLCSLSRLAVCGLLRCVSGFSFSVLIISPAFITFGLTRLTVDDCFVVFVTDGLMPQGARVTKKSAFEDKPLCVPRQLAELLQLSVEEVCADFDAMLRHDWRRLGISAEEVREFCVWRNARRAC